MGEILGKDRPVEAEAPADAKGAECGLDRPCLVSELDAQRRVGLRHPADLVEKIHVPGAATKLAVGHSPETDLLLHPRSIADRGIFGPAQFFG